MNFLATPAAWLRRPAARDGLLVVLAQGTQALIALLVDRYLFRLLPKAEMGALSAGMVLSATLLQASDLGLALTTIRVGAQRIHAGRLSSARALFRNIFAARLLLALALFAAAAAGSVWIARDFLHLPQGALLVVSAAASIIGGALTWWALDVAQARREFGHYAVQQIASALFRTAAAILALYWFFTHRADSAAETILWSMAAFALLCGIFCVFLERDSLRRPADDPAAGHDRLFTFGAYACVISVLAALTAGLDVLMVQHFLQVEDTAVYQCARRLGLALNLLAVATVTVLLPRASALDSLAACAAYARKSLRAGIILALIAAGGLAVTAQIFVPLFAGPSYSASIPVLRVLCLAQGIGILTTPLSLVLYPLHRERALVGFCLLQLAVQFAASVFLIPVWGIEGAAWASVAGRIASALFLAFALRDFLTAKKQQSSPSAVEFDRFEK